MEGQNLRYPLALILVVTDAEMFLKVLLRVFEIVLRLCRDHAPDTIKTVRAFCVPDLRLLRLTAWAANGEQRGPFLAPDPDKWRNDPELTTLPFGFGWRVSLFSGFPGTPLVPGCGWI